jgi:hypothetical protein
MLLLGEGGESKLGTNVNYLIEEYGVSVNSDCVVRTVMPDSPIFGLFREMALSVHRTWANRPQR